MTAEITPALRAAIETVLIATGSYKPALPPGATMPATLAEAIQLWGNGLSVKVWQGWHAVRGLEEAWGAAVEARPTGGHAGGGGGGDEDPRSPGSISGGGL